MSQLGKTMWSGPSPISQLSRTSKVAVRCMLWICEPSTGLITVRSPMASQFSLTNWLVST